MSSNILYAEDILKRLFDTIVIELLTKLTERFEKPEGVEDIFAFSYENLYNVPLMVYWVWQQIDLSTIVPNNSSIVLLLDILYKICVIIIVPIEYVYFDETFWFIDFYTELVIIKYFSHETLLLFLPILLCTAKGIHLNILSDSIQYTLYPSQNKPSKFYISTHL